jgi:type IV secretory pathway protease TraF
MSEQNLQQACQARPCAHAERVEAARRAVVTPKHAGERADRIMQTLRGMAQALAARVGRVPPLGAACASWRMALALSRHTGHGRWLRSVRSLARWAVWGTMALVWGLVLCTPWVRCNLSPSLPLGVYRLHPVPAPLHLGDVVLFRRPPAVQAFWSAWVPLMKPIIALGGDVVCNLGDVLFSSATPGYPYGPILHETSTGQPLPALGEGCFCVLPGTVFVATDHVRSLDSRYFGAVPLAAVTALATPLWTWE